MERKEKKLRLVGLNNEAQWDILKKYVKDVFKEDIPDKDIDLGKFIVHLAGTRLHFEDFVYSLAPQKLLKLFSLCMKRLDLAILPSRDGKDIDFVALEDCDVEAINQYFIIQAQQRVIAQRRAAANPPVVKVAPVTASVTTPTTKPAVAPTGTESELKEEVSEDTESFNNFESENF